MKYFISRLFFASAFLSIFTDSAFSAGSYPISINETLQCEKSIRKIGSVSYDIPSFRDLTILRGNGDFLYLFKNGKVYKVAKNSNPTYSAINLLIKIEGKDYCLNYHAHYVRGDEIKGFSQANSTNCPLSNSETVKEVSLLEDKDLRSLNIATQLQEKMAKNLYKQRLVCEDYKKTNNENGAKEQRKRFAGWTTEACDNLFLVNQEVQKLKKCLGIGASRSPGNPNSSKQPGAI